MPYGLGAVIVGLSLVIVFATFLYLLVNARGLMALFKPVAPGEIKVGQGRRSSRRGAAIALILHFAAWGVAGLAYAYLLADVRATGPDSTPLEETGIVDGER
jgi:hypothetical protein